MDRVSIMACYAGIAQAPSGARSRCCLADTLRAAVVGSTLRNCPCPPWPGGWRSGHGNWRPHGTAWPISHAHTNRRGLHPCPRHLL